MTYQSQRIAYAYFLAVVLLFGLQIAFGFMSLAKYLGPDPLLNIMNFATAKAIHTNLLLVWVITGFMGAAYYMVPEESRAEIYSVRLAYIQLILWLIAGVAAIVGYLFGITAGRKFLEMPQLLKYGVVVVMLIFLYNILMTIRTSGCWTTTEGILLGGLAATALLFIPGLIHFDNYTLDRFYRWWVVHLWVEGVWELVLGAMLAFLLIRLSGADREVMEKWLYVIVGLTFLSGILGTGHHHAALWLGASEHLGSTLDNRHRRVLGHRRRHPGVGPHLAASEPVDTRHPHHHDARTHGLLQGLRHDQSGHHHLRTAGAHWCP
jgi:nitric oxide reductase subunit B